MVPVYCLNYLFRPRFLRWTLIGFSIVILFSCEEGTNHKKSIVPNNDAYDLAFDFREKGMLDSAFIYFLEAKNVYNKNGDNFGAGKCLVNMSFILMNMSDYYGAQETSLEATDYFNADDAEHHHYLATNYNNLSVASLQLRDYENALKFYDLAIQFAEDSLATRVYLNNKAVIYQKQYDYQAAIEIYEGILNVPLLDRKEYARVLSNYSMAKWLADNSYDAFPGFMKALHIRLAEGDLWGQNASYSHLTDFYSRTKTDSARYYAQQRYGITQKIRSADDQIRALEKLIELSPADSSKTYFTRYQRLSDSVQQERTAAKNQFALIRYEVEKSKATNLELQQENDRKIYQLGKQRILIGIMVLLGTIAAIFVYYFQKRRKQRLELEAQHRIKAHQLGTSKKIHDVVANGLYRVMSEIEYSTAIDREELLDKLEIMYEKSRDISHGEDLALQTITGFHQDLKALVRSFYSPDTKIMLVGSDDAFWEGVGGTIRDEIKVVLQELLVNMKKHSKATVVIFKFVQTDQALLIEYKDDGVGLMDPFVPGKGLQNAENRILTLGGHIDFVQKGEKGTMIQLFVPLS